MVTATSLPSARQASAVAAPDPSRARPAELGGCAVSLHKACALTEFDMFSNASKPTQ